MKNNLFEDVKKFIIQERLEYDFELKLETSLQNDLKIFGDDASEILLKFCKKYSIDYQDFKFDKYFRPEPSWTDLFDEKVEYEEFTINCLIEAIKYGELK